MSKKILFKGKKKSADFDFTAFAKGEKTNSKDSKIGLSASNSQQKSLEKKQNTNWQNPEKLDNLEKFGENLTDKNQEVAKIQEKKNEEINNINLLQNLSQKIDFIKNQKTQFENDFTASLETNSDIILNQKTQFERNVQTGVETKEESESSKITTKKFDIFDILKPKKDYKNLDKNLSNPANSSTKVNSQNSSQNYKKNTKLSNDIQANIPVLNNQNSKGSVFVQNLRQNNISSPEKEVKNKDVETVENLETVLQKMNLTEKTLKPKTFKDNIHDGELKFLLTTESIQDEIDQHLAPKDEYENVLLNNNEDINFDLTKEKERLGNKKNSAFRKEKQRESGFEERNKKQNLKQNHQHSNLKFQEIPEDKAKFATACQNYKLEQKKSQFNLILKIIAVGCLLAVLLFYFQGLQPLILSRITQKNQEKIITLSQTFGTQVGSYFEIVEDLRSKIQPDFDQKCTQNYTESQMTSDSQKIEDLINNKLQFDKNLEKPEKYWNLGLDQINTEYLEAVSRYMQSLTVYQKKADYLVDFIYFLVQRNSWQETCQSIKNTNSLAEFGQICLDWKTTNENYKKQRKSAFFNNIDQILTSFDNNCSEVDNAQSPTKWREDWLEKYTALIRTMPNNDNQKLYQMNEQTLTEFQTRSHNIWSIYEQRVTGMGSLYLLNFEK